jgi:tyrosine-protein phosphatase YwqE
MFSIFKRKYPAAAVDFSGVKTDMHSHLLPGIDDGSPDVDHSIRLKKGLEDLGYRQFIATPHIMWDIYRNTNFTIKQALEKLRNEDKSQHINAAAEYFLDEHFNSMVEKDEVLLTIEDKKVLVEFSFVAAPMDLKEQLFNLQIKGYQPVLAHPERYAYFSGNKTAFEEFKSMGCLFQLNLLSLTGYYGKIPQELALWLVAKNFIDLVGTDLHHERHLEALRKGKAIMPVLMKLLDTGRLMNPSLAF